MNLRDWNRVRTEIGELPTAGSGFISAGWGFVGVLVAAIMQLISFAATTSEISPGLTILTVAAAVCGLVGAIVAFLAAYSHRNAHKTAKKRIQSQMDELLPEKLRPGA